MTVAARPLLGLLLPLSVALAGTTELRAATEVDLALVLAVDVSYSMDHEEQRLQRDGFVEAFRSPVIHDAIRKGVIGRIAVIYMEWSGPNDHKIVVPWTVLDGASSAGVFSGQLAQAPLARIRYTSISGAIDYGLRLLGQSGVDPLRRVIDISGDGPNNMGPSVAVARDQAVAQGVTINGLPFMLKRPRRARDDTENLDLYYRNCVIGGPGAFIVPVYGARQFAEAIRTKLVREIAGTVASEPLIQWTQEHARPKCGVGQRPQEPAVRP